MKMNGYPQNQDMTTLLESETPTPETVREVFFTPSGFLAMGFGSGLARTLPGTLGTVVCIPLCLLMKQMPHWWYIGAVIGAFVFGIWLCHRATQALGVHDHKAIVWDEFVGFLVTMIFLEIGIVSVVLAFFLFRVFDIFKPWPISWLDENVHGGSGIMMDDLVAGLFAGVTAKLVFLAYSFL